MNFAPNLSLLFREVPFLDRFARAADCGFTTVEFWWPREQNLDEVEGAIRESGVRVALMNLDAGDMAAGDRGLLSDPDRQQAFADNLPVALEFAERIGCVQLNALLGLQLPGRSREEQLNRAVDNLRRAAREAAQIDATILVEAVNTFENGPYLISHTADALELIERVDEENLALQYDVYHMQRMEGNVSATLRRCHGRIAHVQIADSPGRGEPGTGELNFGFILGVLEEVGYEGHVGLEYIPTTALTEESFGWISALVTG